MLKPNLWAVRYFLGLAERVDDHDEAYIPKPFEGVPKKVLRDLVKHERLLLWILTDWDATNVLPKWMITTCLRSSEAVRIKLAFRAHQFWHLNPELSRLYRDPCISVRLALAHEKAPARVLKRLAQDKDVVVRAAVAHIFPFLPEDIRSILLADTEARVRVECAQRCGTDLSLIKSLIKDRDPSVRTGAGYALEEYAQTWANQRRNVPQWSRILKDDPVKSEIPIEIRLLFADLAQDSDTNVRLYAARSMWLGSSEYCLLAGHPNPEIRMAIATNEHAAKEALEILKKDKDPMIRMRAQQTLGELPRGPVGHQGNQGFQGRAIETAPVDPSDPKVGPLGITEESKPQCSD